jgi:hypothetical protein
LEHSVNRFLKHFEFFLFKIKKIIYLDSFGILS